MGHKKADFLDLDDRDESSEVQIESMSYGKKS
jgi:hypothetical protein